MNYLAPKNVVVAVAAVATLSVGGAIVSGGFADFSATPVAASTDGARYAALQRLKTHFSDWNNKSHGKNEAERIKMADAQLNNAVEAGLIDKAVADRVIAMIPRASKMAVYNNIQDYIAKDAKAAVEHFAPTVTVSYDLHKATRMLISVFYSRDDNTKTDTWNSEYKDGDDEKIVAAYEALAEVAAHAMLDRVSPTAKTAFEGALSRFNSSLVFDTHAASPAEFTKAIKTVYSRTYGNKAAKQSLLAATEIQKALEAVPGRSSTQPVHDVADVEAVTALLPNATAANPQTIKVAPIKKEASQAAKLLKKSASDVVLALDLKVATPAGTEVKDFKGKKVQLAVVLKGEALKLASEKAVSLYHVHNGTVAELPYEVTDGVMVFETDGFSEFALVRRNAQQIGAPSANTTTATTTAAAQAVKAPNTGFAKLADSAALYTIGALSIGGAALYVARRK